MIRKIIFSLVFALVTTAGMAQKKEISQARANVKSGNNLEQAENSMRKLLEDSANADNKKIWLTMFDAIKKQYDQGNEKLYLKQKYDTASLFNIAHRLFTEMERFDSVDARPDKNGKVRPEYRKKHSELLNTLRPNLYQGAMFHIGKGKYAEAYECLSTYIECANSPLFRNYNYLEKDTLMPKAAYWATYCGYKLKDPRKTLHNTYIALKEKAHIEPMLQYLSATYLLEADTVRYLEALTEGFNRYATNPYFYSRLVDYYSSKGDWNKALGVTDTALKANADNQRLLTAKSTILLNLLRYDECLMLCEKMLAANDSLPIVNLNAGLACFNKAVSMDVRGKRNRYKKEILQLYEQAFPYLEKARVLLPGYKDKWALPLYTIYLNLNKGEEFEEIDKLIKDGAN